MTLALRRRFGVIDLSGTVGLAVLHLGLCIAYLVPGLATGVYAPTPGRVSVVTRLDAYGPFLQIGFGATAILLFVAVLRPQMLPVAHSLSGAGMAIYATALWLGFALSDPRPSIVTALLGTTAVLWHIVLVVTYGAALSLVPRSGGHHRRGSE